MVLRRERSVEAVTLGHTGCSLGIIGSRDVVDWSARQVIRAAIRDHQPGCVISGGAPGVDTIAKEEALGAGVPLFVIRPTSLVWNYPTQGSEVTEDLNSHIVIYHPGGFKQRNEVIAQMCHCLIRVGSETTKTFGSLWTADYAEGLGRRVFRYLVPGHVRDQQEAAKW